jgi:hypothetical protein
VYGACVDLELLSMKRNCPKMWTFLVDSVLGRFQHLFSKQCPHKPEMNSQRRHGLLAPPSKNTTEEFPRLNEQINVHAETQVL